MTDEKMKTFCPQCGFGVPVDDRQCCRKCGARAVGPAVDALHAYFNNMMRHADWNGFWWVTDPRGR